MQLVRPEAQVAHLDRDQLLHTAFCGGGQVYTIFISVRSHIASVRCLCEGLGALIAYLRGGRDLRAGRNLWSGRRVAEFGSNPVSSGLPLVPFRNKKFKECRNIRENGAEGQNRTADTMIFSHVLYRLSYLGTPLRLTQ